MIPAYAKAIRHPPVILRRAEGETGDPVITGLSDGYWMARSSWARANACESANRLDTVFAWRATKVTLMEVIRNQTGAHMAAKTRSEFRPDLGIFGVPRLDPGWLYIIKAGPQFKVGKTTNPKRRFLEARTWLPHFDLVGLKPFWNISALERQLLAGLGPFWSSGEWHEFPDDTYDSILEDFGAFYEQDRDMNAVDFIYWMHEFGEILLEYSSRNISLRKWQKEAGAG